MNSDPDLLESFRKQCRTFGPWTAFLLWREQPGVDQDDLIDIAKDVDAEMRTLSPEEQGPNWSPDQPARNQRGNPPTP